IALLEDLVRKGVDISAVPSLRAGLFKQLPIGLTIRDPAEALRWFVRARAVWEELVRTHPTVPRFPNDLALWPAGCRLCQSLLLEHTEAIRSFCQARDLWQRLAAENPQAGLYRVSLVISLGNLLSEQILLGQLAEAGETERQGTAFTNQLVAEFPDV